MKNHQLVRALLSTLIVGVALFFVFGCGTKEDDATGGDQKKEPTRFMFGYGESDISPEGEVILGGYGIPGQHRVTTGVHDPLYSQAALFANDAGEALLIIALDAAGFSYEFGDWGPGIKVLREQISVDLADILELAPEAIIVTSSHSHSAPDLGGFNQDIGEGVDLDLLDLVIDQTRAAARQAAEALEPAELFFSAGELVGYSKRDHDCSPVIDNSVTSVFARRPDGSTIAVAANYAKHPTVIPESNTLASSDFVFGFRDKIAEQYDAPGMFIQGFIAAVHGKNSFSSPDVMWENAREVGEAIAAVVIEGDDQLLPTVDYRIESREEIFGYTVTGGYMLDAYRFFEMPKRTIEEVDEGLFVPQIPISYHRLGPARLAVFPGEPSPEYSIAARGATGAEFNFTIGQGNDAVGYLLEPESVANDESGRLIGYEAKMGLGLAAGATAWTAFETLLAAE